MDSSFRLKYHKLEENHCWFKARRDIISRILRELRVNEDSKILDIGCSGGSLIKFMEQKGFKNVYGIDINDNAIGLCREKGLKNVFVMDAAKSRFNDGEFSAVISSDVLAHIKGDNSALTEWNRILKPSGKLIIFTPALNFLWSGHDRINYHYRRYSKSALIDALKKAGFRIERSSYWNFSLFFPVSLLIISQRIFLKNMIKRSDRLYELNPIINNVFMALLKFENWLLERLNFPVGLSVFAVAGKIQSELK